MGTTLGGVETGEMGIGSGLGEIGIGTGDGHFGLTITDFTTFFDGDGFWGLLELEWRLIGCNPRTLCKNSVLIRGRIEELRLWVADRLDLLLWIGLETRWALLWRSTRLEDWRGDRSLRERR